MIASVSILIFTAVRIWSSATDRLIDGGLSNRKHSPAVSDIFRLRSTM